MDGIFRVVSKRLIALSLFEMFTYHGVVGAVVLSKDLTNNEIVKTVEG